MSDKTLDEILWEDYHNAKSSVHNAVRNFVDMIILSPLSVDDIGEARSAEAKMYINTEKPVKSRSENRFSPIIFRRPVAIVIRKMEHKKFKSKRKHQSLLVAKVFISTTGKRGVKQIVGNATLFIRVSEVLLGK